ncbi:MAG TPA: DsrE family protein [Gammaproteobacteria bacterium]|nr:DsrE family protein [Gammaproteobacteria bacterium]
MIRGLMLTVCVAVIAIAGFLQAPAAFAGETSHKVVIHVDENDAQRMNLALNNAKNVTEYYRAKGEEVEIEMVAYGPGLHMLREDTSPVKARIVTFAATYENVAFRSCGNTLSAMTRKEGKEPPLLDIAESVPSGVVHLMQRQEEGWSYIRP